VKHVRVSITAGGREAEIHPMYGVMTNAPFVERATALQWNYTGDALGILHYVVGDREAFVAAVEEVPVVIGYDVVPATDASFYAYIRDDTTEALSDLFEPITRGGVVVIPPIRYDEDGTVSFSLFGPDAELQAALEAVDGPVDVTVERVGGLEATTAAVETHLTRRQREVIEAAVELGYYEVPREADHEAVAAAIDCAPSTAAEHLRKAESKVVSSLFGR
jgi:predicted DNA binding protein